MGSPFEYVEFQEDERNRIGIHLRNGAKGNQIGQIGPMLGPDPNPASWTGIVDRLNIITNTRETGIWIENSGGMLDLDGNRFQPNILHNNQIESEGIGLKISGDSLVNDIGGWRGGPTGTFININEFFTQEDNYFQGKIAGLHLHNVLVGNPTERNRILNNIISSEMDEVDPPTQRDLRAGPPEGVGLLITGNSFGNVIGESINAPNFINMSRVGIYIDHSHTTLIQGNKIGSSYTPNTIAGVVIRNGRDNEIGGRSFVSYNILEGNGLLGYGFSGPTANPDASGILILGGMGNIVQGNEIRNNSGEGILLVNTNDNLIGGPRGPYGNVINGNTRNGIAIKGNDSTYNIIQSNLVGTNRKGDLLGNEADGIRLSDGASYNLIGGRGPVTMASSIFSLLAPNIIAHNIGHGVHVSGSGSLGNSILYNSIFQNANLGIENGNSGNEELPPPIDMSYGIGVISGSVEDPGIVPPGSVINVFSDSGSQGEVLIGETTVKPGGSWTISSLLPAPFPNITATVTHGITGSTSEFALADSTRGFNISRSDEQDPSQKEIIFGEGDIPVLLVEAIAIGDTVMVNQITLEASGSLLDDSQIDGVKIYRDNNNDGKITEIDTFIAGPFNYDADNGEVDMVLPGILVEPDDPQQWIILYETSKTVQEGSTFRTQITNASALYAEFLFPIGVLAIPFGPFPVASDDFTVGSM
jgi:parallel beta-helix repeat protein